MTAETLAKKSTLLLGIIHRQRIFKPWRSIVLHIYDPRTTTLHGLRSQLLHRFWVQQSCLQSGPEPNDLKIGGSLLQSFWDAWLNLFPPSHSSVIGSHQAVIQFQLNILKVNHEMIKGYHCSRYILRGLSIERVCSILKVIKVELEDVVLFHLRESWQQWIILMAA